MTEYRVRNWIGQHRVLFVAFTTVGFLASGLATVVFVIRPLDGFTF